MKVSVGNFKRLEVWRYAHELALDVYRASSALPAAERYGMTAQLRRAAASIPANLAEGCGRGSDRELKRFLRISLGSATELEYHLLLVSALGFLDPERCAVLEGQVLRVQRMLARLHRSLEVRTVGTRDQRPTATDVPTVDR